MKKRRAVALAGGLGFLASAFVLLVSVVAFRPDHPILWPPSSRLLYLIAHAIFGTALTVLLIGLIYLVILLIAVLAGRMTTGDLARYLLPPAIFVAMLAASIELSLAAFYWPWAVSSATETVLAPPEKWRLISCAEVLARHSDRPSVNRLIHALHDDSYPVRASAAYALAASGDRDALLVLVETASLLPDHAPPPGIPTTETAVSDEPAPAVIPTTETDVSDEPAPAVIPPNETGVSDEPAPAVIPTNETGVSSSVDALYLLGRLTGETFNSVEDLDDRLGPALPNLRWNPQSHLWSISPPSPPSEPTSSPL